MKNFIAHFLCTAACFWASYFLNPLQAPRENAQGEIDKKEEYRLVMLTAKWCGPCQHTKRRFEAAGVVVDESSVAWREVWRRGSDGKPYRGWVRRETDIIEIDVQKRPDMINGRQDKRIPQFILQRKAKGEWEDVRGRVGGFDPGKLRELYPELPEKKIKEQGA